MNFRKSPTVQTLAVFCVVFAVQSLIGLVAQGLATQLFVLHAPVGNNPLSLVLSVYAHGSVGHLFSNALVLVLVGIPVERTTTKWRYHGFFATVGIAAGVSQVVFTSLVTLGTTRPGVLGASGAVFGLFGYLLASNVVADTLLERLPLGARGQLVVLFVLAMGVTLLTASPGVALVAHFTGFVLGALAGRVHLLRTRAETQPSNKWERYG
ncbi:rhomboid family intramembrane serine protease [Halorussus halophilus]|uniref:rhomboid family intramembrane serine protease n=1 Tax=Halorussus halophilus TaxID=2650975 RepID=UPI001300E678|nr:rhomboid family intramembrane serine protease [Halorussus halophilus]